MPLTVQVVTPEREVTVCDDATFVLAHGTEGDVGILPGLAPMLIALGVGPMKIEQGEREVARRRAACGERIRDRRG